LIIQKILPKTPIARIKAPKKKNIGENILKTKILRFNENSKIIIRKDENINETPKTTLLNPLAFNKHRKEQ
jgi:hypothetical protein